MRPGQVRLDWSTCLREPGPSSGATMKMAADIAKSFGYAYFTWNCAVYEVDSLERTDFKVDLGIFIRESR